MKQRKSVLTILCLLHNTKMLLKPSKPPVEPLKTLNKLNQPDQCFENNPVLHGANKTEDMLTKHPSVRS